MMIFLYAKDDAQLLDVFSQENDSMQIITDQTK